MGSWEDQKAADAVSSGNKQAMLDVFGRFPWGYSDPQTRKQLLRVALAMGALSVGLAALLGRP